MLKLALVGDPVEHSLSPGIHQIIADASGFEIEYIKHRVIKGELKAWIDVVKNKKIDGFSVTMPHKTDIIQFLDFVDVEAQEYNAVNAVFNDGLLRGYNTDSSGFCASLKEIDFSFKDKNVTFFGAGGVANALAIKAKNMGAKRVELLRRRFDVKSDTNILINATPLGMYGIGEDFSDFIFLDDLPFDVVVADLIYNPPETSLLAEAKMRGFRTINGFGMLVYQAMLADEIFLGKKLERELIFKKCCDYLLKF